ncbi:MAG TPA: NAD(P)/FAD-dependent oxidoreductase [Candidatus Baltobacteraceae bacterium]|jgi:monoamine oxidase|nr:NAD(P)/FAD-dependent oxidoreductase [Candidatus Baltobacteraceae bacterium]
MSSICDVVVIGAGPAGLAATAVLADEGLRVELLEARERLGGRAYTIDAPGVSMPVELGAEFIHGMPEVTSRLLRRFAISRVEATNTQFTARHGVLVASDEPDEESNSAKKLLARAAAMVPMGTDESVAQALARVTTSESDRMTARSAEAMVAELDAGDPSRASVCAIAEEWAGDIWTMLARPVGGYGKLWKALAESFDSRSVQLRTRTIATRLTRREDGIAVSASGLAGEMHLIQARYAIVTLPLGVLQAPAESPGTLAFEPELPSDVRDALARLAPGHVYKVMLAFSTPFWERLEEGRLRDAAEFRTPEGSAFRTLWTMLPTRSTLLCAWASGPNTEPLQQLAEAEIIHAAFNDIDATFGPLGAKIARNELTWAHVHDWRRDPFARGAYSYSLTGGSDARATIAKAIDGRLWIAGEATATNNEAGTIAGALRSGERAAREIASLSRLGR